MPLRGSLFRKLKKLKKQRVKKEALKFKRDSIKEANQLKKLRGMRIKTEARALLKGQISAEKARIKKARGPTKVGRVEGFLAKQAIKAEKAAVKQARIRGKRLLAGKPLFGGIKKGRTLAASLAASERRRKKKR